MAAAGRARAGRSGGSGRRSLPAKEGGVENLRHREEGDAGINLRHAPRWCSDEARRRRPAATTARTVVQIQSGWTVFRIPSAP